MIIPGWIISTITFPGIILHEWSHKYFCNLTGVRVFKVCYFRFGDPAGYVIHEEPYTYKQVFWISVGPLVINTLLALLSGYVVSVGNMTEIQQIIVIWLGIAFGMQSFPSDHDMKHIWNASRVSLFRGGSILHLFAYIFVAIIWIANKLRFLWFDLFYAIALVYIGSLLG